LNPRHSRVGRLACAGGLALLLGACAGPVAERAFEEVATGTERYAGQRPAWLRDAADEAALRARLDALLAEPLDADGAVAVALLNNRGLQAAFAEIGIGAADLVRSWRPENPRFGYARLRRGGEREIERSVGFDPLSLLLLPFAAEIEAHRFERTRLLALHEALSLAWRARRGWYEAVAAAATAAYARQAREAAEVQLELARRMRGAGSFGELDVLHARLFEVEAAGGLARAEAAATAARERLARLLGLWGDDLAFRLPERLPALPEAPRGAGEVEREAVASRLDVRAARAEAEALSRAYGLTDATRFVNVLEVGYVRNSETGLHDQRGYEIALEVPLFDFGDAKASRAEHSYMRAVHRLSEVAVAARSAAREAWRGYRVAYDLAAHYRDAVLPLRDRVAEEMMLRYNGMLVSVFDLLVDRRQQLAVAIAALEAQRDFWLADADLDSVTLIAIEPAGRPAAAATATAGLPAH